MELFEPSPDELGEAPHILGDDGAVTGVALTTATFASRALARVPGEVYRSLRCIEAAVTEGGVTDGGVSGDLRLSWQVCGGGIRGAGREINMEFVGGCCSETAANLEDEEGELSEERLLLFEDMAICEAGCKILFGNIVDVALFVETGFRDGLSVGVQMLERVTAMMMMMMMMMYVSRYICWLRSSYE